MGLFKTDDVRAASATAVSGDPAADHARIISRPCRKKAAVSLNSRQYFTEKELDSLLAAHRTPMSESLAGILRIAPESCVRFENLISPDIGRSRSFSRYRFQNGSDQ